MPILEDASSGVANDKVHRVFVVHGRNSPLVAAMSTLLKSLGVVPLDFTEVRLSETFRGRYIGDVLDHAFDLAQAIVVLVTGEENVRLRARFALPEDALGVESQPSRPMKK
jgi:hypothetical protein